MKSPHRSELSPYRALGLASFVAFLTALTAGACGGGGGSSPATPSGGGNPPPTGSSLTVTISASVIKIWDPNPKIGFLAAAHAAAAKEDKTKEDYIAAYSDGEKMEAALKAHKTAHTTRLSGATRLCGSTFPFSTIVPQRCHSLLRWTYGAYTVRESGSVTVTPFRSPDTPTIVSQ